MFSTTTIYTGSGIASAKRSVLENIVLEHQPKHTKKKARRGSLKRRNKFSSDPSMEGRDHVGGIDTTSSSW